MKEHKCVLKSVNLKHQLKLVGFTDVAFKAQPDEPIGLALRGLAATLQEDSLGNGHPHFADLVDFIVRRQRHVVHFFFSAEVNGLVDSIEQLLLLQITLHQIYVVVLTRRRRT